MNIKTLLSLTLWTLVLSSFTNAATYEIVGPSEAIANCPTVYKVLINTEGKATNASDIKVKIDSNQWTFQGFDGKGGVFQSYTSPIGTDPIAIMGLISIPGGFNGSGLFGSIKVTPKSWAESLTIDLSFLAGGDDRASTISTLWQDGKSMNILSEVKKISSKVVQETCPTLESSSFIKPTTGVQIVENTSYVSQNPDGDRDFMNKELIKKYQLWIWLIGALVISLIIITTRKKLLEKSKK